MDVSKQFEKLTFSHPTDHKVKWISDTKRVMWSISNDSLIISQWKLPIDTSKCLGLCSDQISINIDDCNAIIAQKKTLCKFISITDGIELLQPIVDKGDKCPYEEHKISDEKNPEFDLTWEEHCGLKDYLWDFPPPSAEFFVTFYTYKWMSEKDGLDYPNVEGCYYTYHQDCFNEAMACKPYSEIDYDYDGKKLVTTRRKIDTIKGTAPRYRLEFSHIGVNLVVGEDLVDAAVATILHYKWEKQKIKLPEDVEKVDDPLIAHALKQGLDQHIASALKDLANVDPDEVFTLCLKVIISVSGKPITAKIIDSLKKLVHDRGNNFRAIDLLFFQQWEYFYLTLCKDHFKNEHAHSKMMSFIGAMH